MIDPKPVRPEHYIDPLPRGKNGRILIKAACTTMLRLDTDHVGFLSRPSQRDIWYLIRFSNTEEVHRMILPEIKACNGLSIIRTSRQMHPRVFFRYPRGKRNSESQTCIQVARLLKNLDHGDRTRYVSFINGLWTDHTDANLKVISKNGQESSLLPAAPERVPLEFIFIGPNVTLGDAFRRELETAGVKIYRR